MVNPYAFAGPVRDSPMFFGRRALQQEILDGLRRGCSFGVTGTIRIGKSSLLFQLRRTLLDELRMTDGPALVPALVRNRDFPEPSLSIVCRRIVEELWATLPDSEPADHWRGRLRLFSGHFEDNETVAAFSQALAAVAQQRDAGTRLAVMIDDVDRLSQYTWSRVFFEELRQLVRNTRDGVRMAVVLTGDFVPWSSHEVMRSPLPDVALEVRTLGVLSRDEAEELIARPTGLDRRSPVVSSIIFETGGHPFLAKYVMNKLLDAVGGELKSTSPEVLRAIVDDYVNERADFRHWALRFTDGDRRAYDLIASSSGTTRDDVLNLLRNPQQASRAIQVLIQTGVVREEPTGAQRYVVAGDMFRHWFYDTRQLTTPASHNSSSSRTDETTIGVEPIIAESDPHEVVVALSNDVPGPTASAPVREVPKRAALPPRPGSILYPAPMPESAARPRPRRIAIVATIAILASLGMTFWLWLLSEF